MINEDALTAALVYEIPEDDPRRLVKKLLNEGVNINSLPPFVLTLDYDSVAPSSYNRMQCNLKIYAFHAQNRDTVHAVHTVSTLLQNVDVTVCKDRIAYIKEEKEGTPQVVVSNEVTVEGVTVIPSSLGVYSCSPQTELYSIAATALSYVTEQTSSGMDNVFKDSRKNRMMNVEKNIDAVSLRGIYDIPSHSSNLAREELFSAMLQDRKMANVVLDQLYERLPYKHTDDRVRVSFEKQKTKLNKERKKDEKKPLTAKMHGNLPGCFIETFEIQDIPSLNVVLNIQHVAEQTIGGGDKKRGALTSGYIYAEMPAHITKIIHVVRELKSLLKYFHLGIVKLPYNKRYTDTVIKTLIANEVYVVSESGKGVLSSDKADFGHYRYTVLPVLEVVTDPYTKPGFNAQGPIWDTSKFNNEHETFLHTATGCRVTTTILSPSLASKFGDDQDLGMLPSLYPHKCRIWLVNRKVKDEFAYEDQVRRFLLAIWARVKFPFTRRPFYASDTYNGFFIDDVKLLKVERKMTDNLKPFYVKKNFAVKAIPVVDNVYSVVEDPTLYDLTIVEIAAMRVEHLKTLDDVQDRYAYMFTLLASDEYKEIGPAMLNFAEYRDIYTAYQQYLESSAIVVKERKVERKSSSSSSEDSSESEDETTKFMSRTAVVHGDEAKKLEEKRLELKKIGKKKK